MTLIGYSTDYDDRAEVITDTLTYSDRSEHLNHTTKLIPLTHLDAVALTHGDGDFGYTVAAHMMQAGNYDGTFDQTAENAPDWLRHLHARLGRHQQRDLTSSMLHLIGYSEARAAFVAYVYSYDRDFEREAATGLQIYPTPWTLAPPRPERDVVHTFLSDAGRPDADQIIDTWTSRPMGTTPQSVADWVDLAQTCRQQRALERFCRTPVGGQVFHTIIRRGRTSTRRIHTFNDTGEEFARLVSGSHHPIGLAGACPCGSQKRFVDCHADLTAPCGCDCGKRLGECCASGRSMA